MIYILIFIIGFAIGMVLSNRNHRNQEKLWDEIIKIQDKRLHEAICNEMILKSKLEKNESINIHL